MKRIYICGKITGDPNYRIKFRDAEDRLYELGYDSVNPAAIQFVTSLYPAKKRGTGMSMYMIAGTGLPAITGSLLGGFIIQSLGYKPLFLIYAAVSGAAVLIYLLMKKRT